MKLRNLGLLFVLVAALVGCSSGVKLNDVAVEDKTGSAVVPQPTPSSGDGSAVTSRTVQPVTLADSANAGPGPNVARIIYFDYDSFAIRPEFQAAIEAHAKFLVADRSRKLAVEGHTDERGGREYNLALGQKRSEAVRRALGLLGVPDAQVEAVSFGKEKPAVSGDDEAALAKNRRAEISYR